MTILPKIREFNRQTVKMLDAAVRAALKTARIEERFGVTIADHIGGSFSPEMSTIRLTITVRDSSGKVIKPEVIAWKRNAKWMGLKESWLGKKFMFSGDQWKITGLREKASKYPVLAYKVGGSGKSYCFQVETVQKNYVG